MITTEKEDIAREMKHIRDSQNKDRLYQASRLERIKNIWKDTKGLEHATEEVHKEWASYMREE